MDFNKFQIYIIYLTAKGCFMSYLTKFLELISQCGLRKNNDVLILPGGVINKADGKSEFYGVDVADRAFIHLAVTAVRTINGETSPPEETTLTVVQKSASDHSTFFVAYNLAPLTVWNFLADETGHITFTNLEKLLNGETLQFHATLYDLGIRVNDPKNYITITRRNRYLVTTAL